MVETTIEKDGPVRPFEDATQIIARLERTLEHKEEALLQSTSGATELKQQLDEANRQTENLKKKLTATVKANELLAAKAMSAEESYSPVGRQFPEAEVTQMKEQWRASQRSFDGELGRLRSEVVKANSQKQQMNAQIRQHRMDSVQASQQVEQMGRQLETARQIAANAATSKGAGRRWIMLSATSGGTALLLLASGLFWQYSQGSQALAKQSPPVVLSAAKSPPPNERASPTPLRALSRLNDSLSGTGALEPEQLLREVRAGNVKSDPGVCNFAWNNGQPALNYSGGKLSMAASLDRCANAVDKFLKDR